MAEISAAAKAVTSPMSCLVCPADLATESVAKESGAPKLQMQLLAHFRIQNWLANPHGCEKDYFRSGGQNERA